jgi:dipeptidyl aminopeptidase/acylaminoacyl peptidase
VLDVKSPINSVGSIKSPVLIVYGNSDNTVPIAQSLTMEHSLRSAGKKVQKTLAE